jgi:hypothetical protein
MRTRLPAGGLYPEVRDLAPHPVVYSSDPRRSADALGLDRPYRFANHVGPDGDNARSRRRVSSRMR